jgi:hypothetical protein
VAEMYAGLKQLTHGERGYRHDESCPFPVKPPRELAGNPAPERVRANLRPTRETRV